MNNTIKDLREAFELLKNSGVIPPVQTALIEINLKEREEMTSCLTS